jgi:pimeloyl-ACP methyl ester carboxylesterase
MKDRSFTHVQETFLVTALFIFALIIMFFLAPDLSREDLELKYAQSPSQFRVINGLRVHYRDSGPSTAPAIVMLHGFGSSLQTWDAWSKTLESSHRVIRMDLTGFGLTGAAPDGNYSDEADVMRLEQFINALGVQEFTLMGHSMGGRIAWNYASANPAKVSRLVLLAPDGYPPQGQKIGDKPYDVGPIAEVIQWVMPKFLVKKSIEPAFFNPSLISDALVERYYDLLRAPTVRQAILARMRQTINSDPVERLKKIQAPTLLLWGQGDVMIPSRNSEDYEKAIKNSKVVVFPKAGHLLQEENPDLALTQVIEFISDKAQ